MLSSSPATYEFGPAHGQLTISTGTAGPAARAGHDLTIAATSWQATLNVAEPVADSEIALWVDPGSLRVLAGHGGASPLSEDDKLGISTTIRQEILGDELIRFQSARVAERADAGALEVDGVLELGGVSRELRAEVLLLGEPDAAGPPGRLRAHITLLQSDYGIKPYTILFGALKVADEVTISIDVTLP